MGATKKPHVDARGRKPEPLSSKQKAGGQEGLAKNIRKLVMSKGMYLNLGES